MLIAMRNALCFSDVLLAEADYAWRYRQKWPNTEGRKAINRSALVSVQEVMWRYALRYWYAIRAVRTTTLTAEIYGVANPRSRGAAARRSGIGNYGVSAPSTHQPSRAVRRVNAHVNLVVGQDVLAQSGS